MRKLLLGIVFAAGCTETMPDPQEAEQRGLRQSQHDGEGLGNDRCTGAGCPKPDTDRDGIIDDQDECPDEPDTDPIGSAFDGCPTEDAE